MTAETAGDQQVDPWKPDRCPMCGRDVDTLELPLADHVVLNCEGCADLPLAMRQLAGYDFLPKERRQPGRGPGSVDGTDSRTS